MKPKSALVGLLSLAAVGLAPQLASAMPNGLPHANRISSELGRLDRRVVRAQFEERFAASRMAKEYERRYRELLVRGGREGFEKGSARSRLAVGTASESLR
jgi:hypothetical protein